MLLLEAGPDYPNFAHLPDDLKLGNNLWLSAYGPHNWGYTARLTPQQNNLTIPRGKATGGSSAVNGQVLSRGIPEDYDNWASWGNTEWSYAQVLPYFRKMENDADFGGAFHGQDGLVPVRRYKREEWMPHAVAFHRACVDADFRDDPDQNHPESTGVSPRARNTIDKGTEQEKVKLLLVRCIPEVTHVSFSLTCTCLLPRHLPYSTAVRMVQSVAERRWAGRHGWHLSRQHASGTAPMERIPGDSAPHPASPQAGLCAPQ